MTYRDWLHMNCQNFLSGFCSLLTIVMLVVNILIAIIQHFLCLSIYTDYLFPFSTKLVSITGQRRVAVGRENSFKPEPTNTKLAEPVIVYLRQIYCHNSISMHVRGMLYIRDVKTLVHTSVVRILHIIEGGKKKWKKKIKKRRFFVFCESQLVASLQRQYMFILTQKCFLQNTSWSIEGM